MNHFNVMKYLTSILLLSLLSVNIQAREPLSIFMNSGDLPVELREKIAKVPFFANLDRNNFGSPYYFTVYISDQATSGGNAAAATSGLLAAVTLGVVPVVSNSDTVVRYEIWINRHRYANYEFSKNFGKVSNIWMEGTQMDKNVLAWVLTTVDELEAQINKDPLIDALYKDHDKYFK
jgi:hypothetical protein